MTSEKIYLDSGIFIAYIHKKHKHNQEVVKCLSTMEELDLDCFYSYWSLIEIEGALIKDYKYSQKDAKKKVLTLLDRSKIKKIPLKLIGLKKSYSANDLLWLIRESKLNNNLSLADSIHSVIMDQNKIKTILTTDNDFSVLKEINVLFPKNVSIMKPKKK